MPMNVPATRSKRLQRPVDWLSGAEWQRTLTALAVHLREHGAAFREADRQALLDGTVVPTRSRARMLREMYFSDDERLADQHLEDLEAIGFSFDEPTATIPIPRPGQDGTTTVDAIADAATALSWWIDRTEPVPEPVIEWVRAGILAARTANRSIVGAFAHPDLVVYRGGEAFPLGAFARELARAEVSGILTAVSPFLTRDERRALPRGSADLLMHLALLAELMAADPERLIRSTVTYPLPDGRVIPVGAWLRNERSRHQHRPGYAADRYQAITSLGLDLDHTIDQQIRNRIYAITDAHYAAFGNVLVPTDVDVYLGPGDTRNVRAWLNGLCHENKRGNIGPAYRAELAEHHIDPDRPFDVDHYWNDGIEALRIYRREPGHETGPVEDNAVRTLASGETVDLSRFVSTQCSRARREPAYPAHRRAVLAELGIDPEAHRQVNRRWQRSLAVLDAFQAANPGRKIEYRDTVTFEGKTLQVGWWLYKTLNRDLGPDRIADLAARGITYTPKPSRADVWTAHFKEYEDHVLQGGEPNPAQPDRITRRDGTEWAIGDWLNDQRILRRTNPEAYERRHGPAATRMTELGFEWNPRAANRAQGRAYFVEFVQRFGHGFVAIAYEYAALDGTTFPLGIWVSNRQRDAKVGRLDPETLADLERHGFRRSDAEARIELDAVALCTYARRCGNLAFPPGHHERLEGGKKVSLRNAATRLRAARAANAVPPAVVAALDAFGFPWTRARTSQRRADVTNAR